ncbi:MAG TPA: molybdopterin-guanine dinucleotide biosynthesis protein B [Candidatus Caldiarchaeum subterraneum]|uniref:Molybdopterin-guanine dinucleotide biosynthesis protein B n=1 Tax=Caldiarchaeum subterraneum TaxID=311458 RepID=A0A832ZVU4_CALS0|nr:molybdopterin-guanine dinucleotide biosynthesis protein B [Candidatus Caldarchaeum subterraneum]
MIFILSLMCLKAKNRISIVEDSYRRRSVTRLIAVFGAKNSGKTTVVEYLIGRLVRDGFNVAALKHIHHEFTIDTEGKDTWKMARRGASIVASISPNEVAILHKRIDDWRINFNKLLQFLEKEDIDVAVAEGFHNILGKTPTVLKIITIKTDEEAHHFINTTSPPILALVKRAETQLKINPGSISIFNLPPGDELYQLVLKSIRKQTPGSGMV